MAQAKKPEQRSSGTVRRGEAPKGSSGYSTRHPVVELKDIRPIADSDRKGGAK
jgi:hypothetical protein